MPKATNYHPHPAFDLSLLPRDAVEPSSSVQKGHYPTNYLNSIHAYPRSTTVESLTDFGGLLAMRVVYISSWLVAMFRPLWVLDTPDLNLFAFFDRPRKTVYLRRAILCEGIAWGHGLSMAYIAHLRGILYNTDQLQMVQPMLGEFQSHRVHLLCFLQALQPSIFTRILVLAIQAVAVPLYYITCLVYSPLCHAGARFISSFAVDFYTDALTALDKGEMPRVAAMEASPVAMWFYQLPAGSRFRDVLLNIRADDAFHSFFNEVCNESHCKQPATEVAKYFAKAQLKGTQ